jgi:hypothetical protein
MLNDCHSSRLKPGEERNLSAMVRVVGNLAIDSLHDRMAFAANSHSPLKVPPAERFPITAMEFIPLSNTVMSRSSVTCAIALSAGFL